MKAFSTKMFIAVLFIALCPASFIDSQFNSAEAATSRPRWFLGGTDRKQYSFVNDREVKDGGNASLRLRSTKADLNQRALVYRHKGAAGLRGKRVRVTGRLKTENVSSAPMMFAQVISQSGRESQAMYGWSTAFIDPEKPGWQTASIILDVPVPSDRLVIGFEQIGAGTTWGDNFEVTIVADDTPLFGYNEVHRKAVNNDLSKPESTGLPLGWETRWVENCEHFSAQDLGSSDEENAGTIALRWRCPVSKSAFFYQNVSAHHYLGKPASVTIHAEFEGPQPLQAVLESTNTDGNTSTPFPGWLKGPIRKTCIELDLTRKARRLRYGLQLALEGEAVIHSVVLASGKCDWDALTK